MIIRYKTIQWSKTNGVLVMNDKLIDLFFKTLAAGLVPVLFWVNSLSVNSAVVRNDLAKLEVKVTTLEVEQKKIHTALKDNQGSLREMRVTVEFIKNLLMEIRTDIRSHNHVRR